MYTLLVETGITISQTMSVVADNEENNEEEMEGPPDNLYALYDMYN